MKGRQPNPGWQVLKGAVKLCLDPSYRWCLVLGANWDDICSGNEEQRGVGGWWFQRLLKDHPLSEIRR